MHTHFFIFLFFYFLGWAQLSPCGLDSASPAWSLAQSQWPGWAKKSKSTREMNSRVHEHCVKVIKLPSHSVLVTIQFEMKMQKGMKKQAYLLVRRSWKRWRTVLDDDTASSCFCFFSFAFFISRCAHGPLFFCLLSSWDERTKKVMSIPVFSDWFRVFPLSAGTKAMAKPILLSVLLLYFSFSFLCFGFLLCISALCFCSRFLCFWVRPFLLLCSAFYKA